MKMNFDYEPSSMAYDVGLLYLTEDIEIAPSRQYVCPPTRTASGNADGYADEMLIVSGWGSLSEGG